MSSLVNIAAIRPDEWNLPLFLHVFGALALIGALVLAATWLISAGSGDPARTRLGQRAMIFAVLPAWLVMRVSAEWISDKQGYADLDEPPDWINIGYITGDAGFLLILLTILFAGLARRKDKTSKTAAVFASLLVVMYVVSLWAMTTKPG